MANSQKRLQRQFQRDVEAMAYARGMSEAAVREIAQLYEVARQVAKDYPELTPHLRAAAQQGSTDLALLAERLTQRAAAREQRDVVDEFFDWLEG